MHSWTEKQVLVFECYTFLTPQGSPACRLKLWYKNIYVSCFYGRCSNDSWDFVFFIVTYSWRQRWITSLLKKNNLHTHQNIWIIGQHFVFGLIGFWRQIWKIMFDKSTKQSLCLTAYQCCSFRNDSKGFIFSGWSHDDVSDGFGAHSFTQKHLFKKPGLLHLESKQKNFILLTL